MLDELLKGAKTPDEISTLLRSLKKAILERALGAELTHHLGYARGEEKPETQDNHRNGTTPKTVLGGPGNDLINGEEGQDDLQGNDDLDRLAGGEGSDHLQGGNGNDYFYGDSQYRYTTWNGQGLLLSGPTGFSGSFPVVQDAPETQAGDDVLEGGAGQDELYGGGRRGRHTLRGRRRRSIVGRLRGLRCHHRRPIDSRRLPPVTGATATLARRQ